MIRARFTNAVLSIHVDLRGFSSIFRLMALAVHDFLHWKIHPAGRSARSILRRNALERRI